MDNGLIVASHHFYDDDVVMKATKWKEHDTEMLDIIKTKTESELSRRKELESVFSITPDTKPLKTVGELEKKTVLHFLKSFNNYILEKMLWRMRRQPPASGQRSVPFI